MFKKILSFMIILISLLINSCSSFNNTRLTNKEKEFLKEKKSIVFVSQSHYPPFEFVGKNNNQTGMMIELIIWMSTELGFKAKFLHTSFYNAQQMVLNNKADVITSFFYSKERDKKFDFTKTVFKVPASIFVTSDNNNIKTIEDLKGKKIAIQKGDYAIDFLKKKGIKFKLVATSNFIESTKKLINKEVDAVVGDEQIVLFYIQQNNLFSRIKLTKEPLYFGLDSMAVKEGNKTIISILNKGITLAQKNGIIKSIERKWLGYAGEKDYSGYIKLFVIIFVLLILTLLSIWYWNILLKRKIDEKTKELSSTLETLKKSEQKFRSFFENSLIPFGLINEDYKYFDANEAALKILNYKDKKTFLKEAYAGKLSPKYQPDGELSTVKAKRLVSEIFKTGKATSFEWMLKKQTGETFWTMITLSLVPYEEKKAVVVTWADLSEIKKLQQTLENEREELEVTLKSIGDAVIKVNTDETVDLMNSVAEELTGWKLENAKGKPLSDIFNIYNSLTKKRVKNPTEKVLNTGKIVTLSNHTILISRNGTIYHIEDSAAPIREKNGNIIGVILVFRDVTEKLQKEKELLKAEKLQSIGLLAGGIAHDFNNLLTSLYGYISLAKQFLTEEDNIFIYIDKAEKSLERTKELTNQLLTFSRGGEPVLENVDIKIIIKEIVNFNLRGSSIKANFDIDRNLYNIEADKGQIGQVLSNLTINAVQAMDKGGNIYVKAENCENPLPDLSGKYVKISFRDEGCGIESDIIEKIFDPYFTTKESGSGLGLTTVYSIVKKHNGNIFVESKKGEGTVFTIYLPALKNEEKDTNEGKNIFSNEKKSGNKQGYKILVMDDEDSIRDLLKDILEVLGNTVKEATEGDEAIKKYVNAMEKGEKFDLVILDLTIQGGKGGKETIQQLREIDPGIIAIVASGYSDDVVLTNYKEFGFKGKLKKPYLIDDIKIEISKIMEDKNN